jgi:hypothetical protein
MRFCRLKLTCRGNFLFLGLFNADDSTAEEDKKDGPERRVESRSQTLTAQGMYFTIFVAIR